MPGADRSGRRLDRHQKLWGISLVRSGGSQPRLQHFPPIDIHQQQTRLSVIQLDRPGGSQSQQQHCPSSDVYH